MGLKVLKRKPNKQHDARAASLKRIAKDIRAAKTEFPMPAAKRILQVIARAHDTEALRLRAMR